MSPAAVLRVCSCQFELVESAGRRIEELREKGEKIDYLTIVPDGELIDGLRQFKIPVALISNGSLMADPQLREDLMGLDWLSVKIDGIAEYIETLEPVKAYRLRRPHVLRKKAAPPYVARPCRQSSLLNLLYTSRLIDPSI